MKHSERELLKEDPFELFISNVIGQIKQYRKQIILGAVILAILVIAAFLVLFFTDRAKSQENDLFTEGVGILNSVALTTEQKIDELKALKVENTGKPAVLNLHLANLYIAKGDRAAASQLLQGLPKFSMRLLEDQKSLIMATLLADEGKNNEAIDILQRLLGDSASTVNPDLVLFRLAEYQVRVGNVDVARDHYNRLIEQYPQSMFAYKAQQDLEKIKK